MHQHVAEFLGHLHKLRSGYEIFLVAILQSGELLMRDSAKRYIIAVDDEREERSTIGAYR
jgi:hypothetical protein